jgi:hypothetical protein
VSCKEHVTEIAGLLAHSNEPKAWLAVSIVIVEIDKLHLGMDSEIQGARSSEISLYIRGIPYPSQPSIPRYEVQLPYVRRRSEVPHPRGS